jgi:outer membrane protein OmpA-like peptidoglycan-associated protein
MKRGRSFWVLWAFAATGISLSGCAMSKSKRDGVTLGAMVGAIVGGGVGAGVGPEFRHKGTDEDDERAAGIAIGVGAGAIIGGLIGYALASDEEAPPPPPPAEPAPRAAEPAPRAAEPEPARIILRGVNFDYNKSNIKSEFVPILDEAAQTLKDNPDINVRISGHTDSIGTDDYNQRLSERRAQAVKQYLVSKGIASSRLSTEGRGEREPVAQNTKGGRDNPEGRAMNRRAELTVSR